MADTNHDSLLEVEELLLESGGGREKVCAELPRLVRLALDEVIDTPRTGRIWISDLEKTEKTYIGTKVEILIRDYFHLPKGRLDLRIGDRDVDVKNTIGNTWTIPVEAIGNICILVSENDEGATCSFGLIVAEERNLTRKPNRDSKRQVSAAGKKNIHWIFENAMMPSFWPGKKADDVRIIMDPSVTGAERIRRLFRLIQETPIPREIIISVARQSDSLKRIRKNGGARDRLAKEGIAILSGAYHSSLISVLGLPPCSRTEFISVQPDDDRAQRKLRSKGLL